MNRRPDYEKSGKRLCGHKNTRLFTDESVQTAINRAKKKGIGINEMWPQQPGHTTVYVLVERIIEVAARVCSEIY